ncbi:MAG: hypothetical protein EA413_03220 [Cyanobium sp. PLM2.Bin73]|jgi:hypothetical protein|nr:MAG: hypothetical protein EA413_03220 [Cyanobium sp. PLM2.Bin73]
MADTQPDYPTTEAAASEVAASEASASTAAAGEVPASEVAASEVAVGQTPATEPSVETSTTVPPIGAGPTGDATPASDGDGEGGEWALLVEKVQAWWSSGELQKLWQQSRTPLTLGLALFAVLLVLQVYAGLLGAINSLPLVPGLLELVGLIWAVRYGLPRLLRRSEREQLLGGLQKRWSSFRGRS